MSTHKKALPIPKEAQKDNDAVELLRVWAANGDQHIVLATDVWDDPATWGILLVDLAKHIANAYSQTDEMNYEDVLVRIKEGLDVEWLAPTDEPSGSVEQ